MADTLSLHGRRRDERTDVREEVRRLEAAVEAERATLERLDRVGEELAGERDPATIIARLTSEAAALVRAQLEHLEATTEALRLADTRYRFVLEATADGIWFWDCQTNEIECNDRLFELMGLTRGEVGAFQSWSERIHPDDRARLEAALHAHLERRAPYRADPFRLRHASGEYRWCVTSGQAEWDDAGRPLFMAGAVRDITDEKSAQDALKARELRYAQILDSVSDMIFCKDESFAVTFANRATCEYFDASADDLRGVFRWPSASDSLHERYLSDDRAVFTRGTVVERTMEEFRPTGAAVRIFHTVKSPIFDASGRVTEVVGVARDVTERRREIERQAFLAKATAVLGSSLDYEKTLANITTALVPQLADWATLDMLDGDTGEIRRVAVAHVDPAKGHLAREILKRAPQVLDGPDGVLRTGKAELKSEICDELLADALPDPEVRSILKSLGLASVVVVPLVIGGEPVGALSLVSADPNHAYDTSDLLFAEELARRASMAIDNAQLYAKTRAALDERDRALSQVRELNATLERRVEERTAALLDVNKELEAFSYTVSHDLRAPIRHISGFVDLLRVSAGDALDDKSLRHLTTIKNAASHMGALIDGLLGFSRLGRTELAKQPVALREVVDDVLDELEVDTKRRALSFEIGPLPTVEADPTMLRIVIANLLSNAVKYTSTRDHAAIKVGSERQRGELVVFVEDDGVGFDMTYASKLFGVFQRLHSDPRFEGTGIGLATVQRIVQRHGGRVWAESGPGGGARFLFTLPDGGATPSASPPHLPAAKELA